MQGEKGRALMGLIPKEFSHVQRLQIKVRSYQGGRTRDRLLLASTVTRDTEDFTRKRRGSHWVKSAFSERAFAILEEEFQGVGDSETQTQ